MHIKPGFATTSRITAGSNAALYAHSADKDWENDAAVTTAGCNPSQVNDIAHQLIHGDVGKHFKVSEAAVLANNENTDTRL